MCHTRIISLLVLIYRTASNRINDSPTNVRRSPSTKPAAADRYKSPAPFSPNPDPIKKGRAAINAPKKDAGLTVISPARAIRMHTRSSTNRVLMS